MTLGLYLPLKLKEQIEAFKASSGNINVDYRTTATSDLNVLGTSYTRVTSPVSISLNCLPLRATEGHISGHNQLFKEFPIDVLLENMSGEQRHYFYTVNNNQLISVRYSHTESERVGSISYMYHYYTFVDTSLNESYFTGKTIKPGIYSTNKISEGLVNIRDCLALTCITIPISFSSGLLKLTQQVPEIVTNNLNVPIVNVDDNYLGMQSIIVTPVIAPKTSTKTRFIAIINDDDTVNGSPVLTSRLPNYNVYYLDTGTSANMPDAFSFPLKGGERALFSTTVVDNSSDYLGILSNTLLSFSEKYAPDLGKSFACLRIRLPDTPYTSSEGTPKVMKISVDDGTTWTSFNNYSKQDESLFKTEITNYFKSKGIRCYPCENSTFILQNIADQNNKFVIQYHPDYYIESVINLPTLTTDTGNELLFTSLSFPENLSPSRVSLYGSDGPPTGEDPEYVEYAFRIPPKKPSETLSNLFKTSATFTVNKASLITTTKYNYFLNNEVKEKVVNFSAETVDTVLDKVILDLNTTITNATFTKSGEDIVVTNKTSTWSDFGLKYEGLVLKNPNTYLLEEIGVLSTILFKGV